jgi:hypothetical protein
MGLERSLQASQAASLRCMPFDNGLPYQQCQYPQVAAVLTAAKAASP